MKAIQSILLLVPVLLLLVQAAGSAAVKPSDEAVPALAPIWAAVSAGERLKAVRAAELDADRLLAERIYGAQVDAGTRVVDLALEQDEVRVALQATLKGAVTTEGPEFKEDGQVQVVRGLKIEEVVQTLTRVVKGRRIEVGDFKPLSDQTDTKREVRQKLIDVTGNSAISGSPGHDKILSKRAAEADAYRRLAARMAGVKITGTTTVRDLCLRDDRIMAALSHVLKAAVPIAVRYLGTDGCEVTMELKVEDVVRTTMHFADGDIRKAVIKDSLETKSFTETGSGAVRARVSVPPPDEPVGGESETQMILKEVIRSEPLVQ